ncbi:hypothetical protein V8E55_008655 [Tylopilus felleus]
MSNTSRDDDADTPEQSPELLAMLTHPGVPPHRLDLKVGCICSILHNLSIDKDLVHNACVQVTALHRRFIEVRLLHNDEIHCIPRISFQFSPASSSWSVQRKQFPLRLAYACTFNGCQGLMLTRSIIDLRTHPFTHGQLYTALSHVRRREDCLLLFDSMNEDRFTYNIVHRQLLL